MRNVLFLLAVLSFVGCLAAFGVSMLSQSAVHETEAAILFLAFVTALSGAAVLEGLERLAHAVAWHESVGLLRQLVAAKNAGKSSASAVQVVEGD